SSEHRIDYSILKKAERLDRSVFSYLSSREKLMRVRYASSRNRRGRPWPALGGTTAAFGCRWRLAVSAKAPAAMRRRRPTKAGGRRISVSSRRKGGVPNAAAALGCLWGPAASERAPAAMRRGRPSKAG